MKKIPALTAKSGSPPEPSEAGKAVRGTAAFLFPVAAAVPPEMGTYAPVGKRRSPEAQPKKKQPRSSDCFFEPCGGFSDVKGSCKKCQRITNDTA